MRDITTSPDSGNYSNHEDTAFPLDLDKVSQSLNDLPADDDEYTWEDHLSDIVDESTAIIQTEPLVHFSDKEVFHRANLLVLSGAPKSRKSCLAGIITAGAIRRESIGAVIESLYVSPNPDGHAVIFVDTENPQRIFQRNIKAILKLAGCDHRPDFFYPLHYRKHDKGKRRSRLDSAIRQATLKHNGIALIVIDGIADFIYDANDEKESAEITEWVCNLADGFNVGVIAILHLNKNTPTERGHLGSIMQRKADALIRVIKDGQASYTEAVMMREVLSDEVPVIAFRQDDGAGHPIGLAKKADDHEDSHKLCLQIYGQGQKYRYGDAISAIRDQTGKGEEWAKKRHAEWSKNEWIVKGKGGGKDGRWQYNPA